MLPIIAKPDETDLMSIEERKRVKPPTFVKDLVLDLLKANILTVTFIKVDGTTRVMKCTLKEDMLPKADISKLVQEETNKVRKTDNVVAVWDVDNTGWRSFRLDSVQSIAEYVPAELLSHD